MRKKPTPRWRDKEGYLYADKDIEFRDTREMATHGEAPGWFVKKSGARVEPVGKHRKAQ